MKGVRIYGTDIWDVQRLQNRRRHCWTGFTWSESGGAEPITDEFDFRKLDREKLLLYAQKYPRPVKFELLESLARTGAVLPNGKSSTLHEIRS